MVARRNWKVVLKSIHALARLAHCDVPGFYGPHVGVRNKNRTGGGLRNEFSRWGRGRESAADRAAQRHQRAGLR